MLFLIFLSENIQRSWQNIHYSLCKFPSVINVFKITVTSHSLQNLLQYKILRDKTSKTIFENTNCFLINWHVCQVHSPITVTGKTSTEWDSCFQHVTTKSDFGGRLSQQLQRTLASLSLMAVWINSFSELLQSFSLMAKLMCLVFHSKTFRINTSCRSQPFILLPLHLIVFFPLIPTMYFPLNFL